MLIEQLRTMEEAGAPLDVSSLWRAVETVATRETLAKALHQVKQLVPDGDGGAEAETRDVLARRYNTVRPFLSLLGESRALGAAARGNRVLAAVKKLPTLSKRKVRQKPLLPSEIDDGLVPPSWRHAVYANPDLPTGAVDRNAYVVCVLEQLYRALSRRDIFASPSQRWSDLRARLLDGKRWDAVGDDVLAGLSLVEPVEQRVP